MAEHDMSDDEVAHFKAVFNVRHAIAYGERCERFYRRADILLGAVQILGGSGLAFATLSDHPVMATITGFAVAVASAISLLAQLGVAFAGHRQIRRQAVDLLASCPDMNAGEINRSLQAIIAAAESGPASLSRPAYNDAAHQVSHPEALLPLGRFERLMAAIT